MSDHIPKADQVKLEAFFNAGRNRISSEPEYWINGSDGGVSYCYDCCKKEAAKFSKEDPDGIYSIDGGWSIEGDSTPFCEICQKLLENTLTNYGCESEVAHFLENGFDFGDYDCRAMSEVIGARGWGPWEDEYYKNEYEKERDLHYFSDLYKLCMSILEKLKVNA